MLTAAQTADDRAVLRSAIASTLRPMLGDGGHAVVEKLINVKPTGAISQNFEIGRVKTALFGRLAAQDAPDCRSTKTTAGEPDEGLCIVESGNRDSPTSAYTMLAFSKIIGKAMCSLFAARRNDVAIAGPPQ